MRKQCWKKLGLITLNIILTQRYITFRKFVNIVRKSIYRLPCRLGVIDYMLIFQKESFTR